MDEPATTGPERILIIGRSPGVILDAAGGIRKARASAQTRPTSSTRC